VGECRDGVLSLQSEEGRDIAVPRGNVAGANALPTNDHRSPQERALVPAQLSAPKLARLSVLGYRTRSLGFGSNWPRGTEQRADDDCHRYHGIPARE